MKKYIIDGVPYDEGSIIDTQRVNLKTGSREHLRYKLGTEEATAFLKERQKDGDIRSLKILEIKEETSDGKQKFSDSELLLLKAQIYSARLNRITSMQESERVINLLCYSPFMAFTYLNRCMAVYLDHFYTNHINEVKGSLYMIDPINGKIKEFTGYERESLRNYDTIPFYRNKEDIIQAVKALAPFMKEVFKKHKSNDKK